MRESNHIKSKQDYRVTAPAGRRGGQVDSGGGVWTYWSHVVAVLSSVTVSRGRHSALSVRSIAPSARRVTLTLGADVNC